MSHFLGGDQEVSAPKRRKVNPVDPRSSIPGFEFFEPGSIPPTPIDVDEPVLVTQVRGTKKTRASKIRQPNIRVVIRRRLTDRKKELQAALRQCERDCKSLCNKKLNKTKKRTAKKKNAKKGKK